MKRFSAIACAAALFVRASPWVFVQSSHELNAAAAITKDAQGQVYVACSLPGTLLDGDLDPHGHAEESRAPELLRSPR